MHPNTIRISVFMFCTLFIITTSSCKKFLETYTQNNSFIESVTDLDELLVGEAYMEYTSPSPMMLFSMDDDVEMGRVEYRPGREIQRLGFFHWQPEPRMNSEGVIEAKDALFTDCYKRIACVNTILHHVPIMADKGEPAATLNRISGEAHFLRAFYYFILVNTYGKPYKTATADTDFGVPLKTDVAIKGQFASRNSTKEVYSQIVADLLEAETKLAEANSSSTIHANQQAAQALLSRVYLFMENYEGALLYADKVIKSSKYQLTDLNNHPAGVDFLKRNSPEVVFTMGASELPNFMSLAFDSPPNSFFRVSDELAAAYAPTDLRKQAFFIQTSKGYLTIAKKRQQVSISIEDVSDVYLIRLSEQYLNKAEALVGLDRAEEGRAALQELRKKRFDPAAIPEITAEGAALMNAIREERRLELCFETHRWFDLRRYGVNAKYPFSKTIRHRNYEFMGTGYQEDGYYELNPYAQDAAAYIVPIANDEIVFNNGLLANEPRPIRLLKK